MFIFLISCDKMDAEEWARVWDSGERRASAREKNRLTHAPHNWRKDVRARAREARRCHGLHFGGGGNEVYVLQYYFLLLLVLHSLTVDIAWLLGSLGLLVQI